MFMFHPVHAPVHPAHVDDLDIVEQKRLLKNGWFTSADAMREGRVDPAMPVDDAEDDVRDEVDAMLEEETASDDAHDDKKKTKAAAKKKK